jgi:hypothetical protein
VTCPFNNANPLPRCAMVSCRDDISALSLTVDNYHISLPKISSWMEPHGFEEILLELQIGENSENDPFPEMWERLYPSGEANNALSLYINFRRSFGTLVWVGDAYVPGRIFSAISRTKDTVTYVGRDLTVCRAWIRYHNFLKHSTHLRLHNSLQDALYQLDNVGLNDEILEAGETVEGLMPETLQMPLVKIVQRTQPRYWL